MVQQRRGFFGYRRALEEARILRAATPHGIAEDEVVEIAFGNVAVLDELERIGQRIRVSTTRNARYRSYRSR